MYWKVDGCGKINIIEKKRKQGVKVRRVKLQGVEEKKTENSEDVISNLIFAYVWYVDLIILRFLGCKNSGR